MARRSKLTCAFPAVGTRPDTVTCCRSPERDASGHLPKWTMRNKMSLLFLDIPPSESIFICVSPLQSPGHVQFVTVAQIMADETVSILFGKLVEKCLCGESFWFLNEVSDKSP